MCTSTTAIGKKLGALAAARTATCEVAPVSALLTGLNIEILTCSIGTLILVNSLLTAIFDIIIGVHCASFANTKSSLYVTLEILGISVFPTFFLLDFAGKALFILSTAL